MSAEFIPPHLQHEHFLVTQRVQYTSMVLNEAQQDYNQACKDQEAFFRKLIGQTALKQVEDPAFD